MVTLLTAQRIAVRQCGVSLCLLSGLGYCVVWPVSVLMGELYEDQKIRLRYPPQPDRFVS